MMYKTLFTAFTLAVSLCPLRSQVDQIDRFDGPTLNSRWVTTFTTKGGGSYRQTNGVLNFTVATGSAGIVENNIHVLNTNSLPTDRSWTLVIGMHHNTDFSPTYGAAQLQLGVFDARTVSPSNTLGVGFTLVRYFLKNNGNPLFGFGGTNLPKWHAADGIWTNASSDASAKFVYDATTRILQAFVTTDGNNPVDNHYNYIPAGPASSVSIPSSAKLNFYVIQNVYSVAVPVGKMWVDNYKLSFAPLDGRLYPGLPATLSRRPGQDLFLSVSPRDQGTFTYEWKKNGQAINPLPFGKQVYFKPDMKSADSGTYTLVVRRNGVPYATHQTVLTVANAAPGAAGSDDFSTSSTRWSGMWGFDAHDSYLEVNGGRLDYVLDKAGSENSQAFQIWDNRLPSSQNWEVAVDTFMEPEFSPERYFALRLGVAAPVNAANGLAALNGLEINFANSRYGGGKKIQNIKTIPTGDGWLELNEPALSPSTTAVALRMKWDAGTKILTSYYDSNGATGGYVWTQSATNNLSSLPSSQLAAGFYALISGIAEPSFLLPAGQTYFKNFVVRTGPVIPVQMPPQTGAQGGTVTFTAPAEGSAPLAYQWRKNGVAINGQTNSALTLSGLSGGDAGQYSVLVSNALGTIISSNALLSVLGPPAFPEQAADGLRGNLGAAFRFEPSFSGSAPLFTSSNLPPGLTLNRSNGVITGSPSQAGYYRSVLVASNSAGTARLPLNFTIPGSRWPLPLVDDFSRSNPNRYLGINYSRTNLEARGGITGGRLQFSSLANDSAENLFPAPFSASGKAVAALAPNLALSMTQSWMVEADVGVPASGLAGLDVFVDSTNRPIAQALARRLNLYFHRGLGNPTGRIALNAHGINNFSGPEPEVTNSNAITAKLRLILGVSGTNRLLSAWGTWDMTGQSGWFQLGPSMEMNPAGTSNPNHFALGQAWSVAANDYLTLALFGQFEVPNQASWIDNLRVAAAVPPLITSTTNFVGQVGKSLSYRITATNSPVSYQASNLPAGLVLDGATGWITGAPTSAGSTPVILSASSPAGRGSRTNSAIILPPFTGPASVTGSVGVSGFTHQVSVGSHNFGSNLKFSAAGLPPGTGINATSGVISGRPTVVGTFSPRVTISVGTVTAFRELLISVGQTDGSRWVVGSAVSYPVNLGTGVTGYQATGLPTGLSINSGSGLISGIPREAGEYTVTVNVPSRGLSTTIPFLIHPANVIYVNVAATGANSGTSWANAYTNLQAAINAAGVGSQIWVARGTYKPTSYLDPKVTSDPRSRSFLMKGGVSVLGGFAGTESRLTQRDVDANLTILSGDFNGNDSDVWPPDSTRNDNAYHVVCALSQTRPIILDGLTFTGGYANNSNYTQPNNGSPIPVGYTIHRVGGGMFVLDTDYVLKNCFISENFSADIGGGGLIGNASPPATRKLRAIDCVFKSNLALGAGGALDIEASDKIFSATGQYMTAELVRCLFESNEARAGGKRGLGAGINLSRATAKIVSCAFLNNYANGNSQLDSSGKPKGEGGGVFARPNCTLRIANSIFSGNRADREGGGISVEEGVAIEVFFSTFYHNDCLNTQSGGAAIMGWYNPNGNNINSLSGAGNIFWQNTGVWGDICMTSSGDIYIPPSRLTSTLVTDFLGNNIGTILGGDPLFVDPEEIDFRIRSLSPARGIVLGRPTDFADLDDDGNTTELLPCDAADVPYPPNPPYNAGAYQTLAP